MKKQAILIFFAFSEWFSLFVFFMYKQKQEPVFVCLVGTFVFLCFLFRHAQVPVMS